MSDPITPGNIMRASVTFQPASGTVAGAGNVKAYKIIDGVATLIGDALDGVWNPDTKTVDATPNGFYIDVTVPLDADGTWQIHWKSADPVINVEDSTSVFEVAASPVR